MARLNIALAVLQVGFAKKNNNCTFFTYNFIGDVVKLKYNIIAFLFIGIFGALGHFFYEWSGQNTIVGYFFPINESTCEHLKLLFFPTIIFSIVEYSFVKQEIKNYTSSITISVFVGMLSIVMIFYTYQGVIGKNIDFINILIFYIAIIIMLVTKNKIIESEKFAGQNSNLISILICFIITLVFIFLTYNPPALGIFETPQSQ